MFPEGAGRKLLLTIGQNPHLNLLETQVLENKPFLIDGLAATYLDTSIIDQNINCGYSLEPPHQGGSNEYPQFMFGAEI